ncbi:hypothetical protein IAT40_001240 [Kwoniella sp. CBS 6097]
MSATETTVPEIHKAETPEYIKQWQEWSTDFHLTTLQPLFPIKDLIFDILEHEKSAYTLIRVSKELYDRIIPWLYFDITLNVKTIDCFKYGLLKPIGKPANQTQYRLGKRMRAALKYVENVYIMDLKAAKRLIELCTEYDDDVVKHWKRSKQPPAIFPNLKHLSLGFGLIGDIATAHTFAIKSSVHALNPPPLYELCEVIANHARAETMCMGWPHAWERPEEFYDSDCYDDIFEPTLANAVTELLICLDEYDVFEKIRIHILSSHLSEALILDDDDEEEFSAELEYEIIRHSVIRPVFMLNDLYDHCTMIDSIPESPDRPRYFVPPIVGLEEAMLEEQELMDEIKTSVVVMDETKYCPCDMWE